MCAYNKLMLLVTATTLKTFVESDNDINGVSNKSLIIMVFQNVEFDEVNVTEVFSILT